MTFDSSNRTSVEAMSTEALIENIETAMSNGCIHPCFIYDCIDEALCRLASEQGISRNPVYLKKNKGPAGGEDSKGADREDLEKRMRDVVVEQLGVNPGQVNDNASFINDLGADSLDCVELLMAFEEEFGICIPEADAREAMGDSGTFKQAVDYMYGRMHPEERK